MSTCRGKKSHLQINSRCYARICVCCNKHTCWCLLYLTWSWWNQNALNRFITRAGRTIKATVRLNHQSVFVFRCRSIATRTSEAKPIYNLESVHKGSPNFLGSHASNSKLEIGPNPEGIPSFRSLRGRLTKLAELRSSNICRFAGQ